MRVEINATFISLRLLIFVGINMYLFAKTGASLFSEFNYGSIVAFLLFEFLMGSLLVGTGYYFVFDGEDFFIHNIWMPWFKKKIPILNIVKIKLGSAPKAGPVLTIFFNSGKKKSYGCAQIPEKGLLKLRDHLKILNIEFESYYSSK